MSGRRRGLPEGVQERHQGACKSRDGGRCNCTRSYRGALYDPRTKDRAYSGWRKGPAGLAEAEKWRAKAKRELAAQTTAGTAPSSLTPTLQEAWDDWIKGARAGTIANRKGDRYKPSALAGYERAWKNQIQPDFGSRRIATITRQELQKWVDRKASKGAPKSTINNALDPLRVLFRRARKRGEVVTIPTADLELPANAEEAMRFAEPEEAAKLIEALPDAEKALWASAFYGGLRRGELRGLRWDHVNLAEGVIVVERSWVDDDDGAPKSKAGVRRVPIIPQLAEPLKAHQKATSRDGSDLVFGRTAADPFHATTIRSRALKAWAKPDPALDPITLHQCRHTAASFMIAAGANAKALSIVMGHASIEITFNRYGHLMPGSEADVGRMLADYIASHGIGVGSADT